MSLERDKLEYAWCQFIELGQIDDGIVRHHVACSWHRCRKQKTSSSLRNPLPPHMIEIKRQQNHALIEAAHSVMQDIATALHKSLPRFSVLLLDAKGDTIDVINQGYNLVTLGHHCSEMDSGTTAGGIALIDGVGIEVTGFEHLFRHAHKWHTIGFPIRHPQKGIVGVFGVLNPDGASPPLTMQLISLGAQLIETRLKAILTLNGLPKFMPIRITGNISSQPFAGIVGNSPDLGKVIRQAQKAASSSSNILIEGESGTGKGMLAKAIHDASRREGAFVTINCGAIPKELMYSELFGYEEGAFTGAKKGGNPGKLEFAKGGTLFLDEIGEMPLDMQVSLLKFLEDKSLTRIGGHQVKSVDVRIIAATNRNLFKEVVNGNFRKDLYYRLNVIYLHMPALREYSADIPLLAHCLLEQLCEKHGRAQVTITESVMDQLKTHTWPGNVRELQNVIESSLVMANGLRITVDCLPSYFRSCKGKETLQPGPGNLQEYEKAFILDTLNRFNGNISRTAKALNISRTTLYNKLRQMGI